MAWRATSRLFGWIKARISPVPERANVVDDDLEIPDKIRSRLIPDNEREPLWPQFRRYGRGPRGVTQERRDDWVVRDGRGCVVGGARVVALGPGRPHSIDVAVDPRKRRKGHATQLYRALTVAGIDVERSSDTSMRYGTMTALGYAFMVGRRRSLPRQTGDDPANGAVPR